MPSLVEMSFMVAVAAKWSERTKRYLFAARQLAIYMKLAVCRT